MRRRYSQEVRDFIEEHAAEGSIKDMAERVSSEFGITFTLGAMKAYFNNHKLRAAPRKGRPRPEKRITTPEQDRFIRENVKGTGYQAMADMVNERFGTSFTKKQMKAYYARNKLNSGLTGQFQKGNVPATKGKTWAEYMSPEGQANSRKTQFKKGHIPHNGGLPIGTLRIRREHESRGGKPYYWEKVAQPNVWRMRHVLVWEEHNGPVPDGQMVTFANGDTLNCDISNLILETRAQHAVKNFKGLRISYDKESAEACNQIADLKMAAWQAKQKGRKNDRNEWQEV